MESFQGSLTPRTFFTSIRGPSLLGMGGVALGVNPAGQTLDPHVGQGAVLCLTDVETRPLGCRGQRGIPSPGSQPGTSPHVTMHPGSVWNRFWSTGGTLKTWFTRASE